METAALTLRLGAHPGLRPHTTVRERVLAGWCGVSEITDAKCSDDRTCYTMSQVLPERPQPRQSLFHKESHCVKNRTQPCPSCRDTWDQLSSGHSPPQVPGARPLLESQPSIPSTRGCTHMHSGTHTHVHACASMLIHTTTPPAPTHTHTHVHTHSLTPNISQSG